MSGGERRERGQEERGGDGKRGEEREIVLPWTLALGLGVTLLQCASEKSSLWVRLSEVGVCYSGPH